MGDTGLEPDSVKTSNDSTLHDRPNQAGAESGAVDTENGASDLDLQRIIDAWPTMPVAVKASIVAMVKAAQQ